MQGPLNGVKVIDFGILGVGPWSTSLLGYLGADVIKIVAPADPSIGIPPLFKGMSGFYILLNTAKRSMSLNLKTENGAKIARKLIGWADVIIQNFRPGAAERLGMGYEQASRLNSRIVYCSISGYGETGPMSTYGAADHFIQAFSAFAALNGPPGGPPEILRYPATNDFTTSMSVVEAVLAALLERDRSGMGQFIKMNMVEASFSMQGTRAAEYFATGDEPARMGSACAAIVPSQAFKALDRYISISVLQEEHWPKLCEALGLGDLAGDPRFTTNPKRVENRESLVPLLENAIAERPSWWWLQRLEDRGVPSGLVYQSIEEILGDPQVQANEAVVELVHPYGAIRQGGLPWKFSKTPAELRPCVPPGANTDEIIAEMSQGT